MYVGMATIIDVLKKHNFRAVPKLATHFKLDTYKVSERIHLHEFNKSTRRGSS
jgi:hypothetical protein